MANDFKEKQLNQLLNQATDIKNINFQTDAIITFCDTVNSYYDGCRFATILISKKINSEEEWELLQTLNVLRLCAEKCGETFHKEIGMFRFLNNMIKLISPKYLGHLTTAKVKEEICLLLKEWAGTLKEAKINEAYNMLKQQNLIPETILNKDKPVAEESSLSRFVSKPVGGLVVDEKISKRLNKLLKSRCPEDLEEANRLIKTMVKEDELKIEKRVARNSELEFISGNVQLLKEMLSAYDPTKSIGVQERELMEELYNTCKAKKDRLLSIAEETNDNDDLIAEIVRVNEDLGKCVSEYKLISLSHDSTKKLGIVSPHGTDPRLTSQMLIDTASTSRPSASSSLLFDEANIVDELKDIFTPLPGGDTTRQWSGQAYPPNSQHGLGDSLLLTDDHESNHQAYTNRNAIRSYQNIPASVVVDGPNNNNSAKTLDDLLIHTFPSGTPAPKESQDDVERSFTHLIDFAAIAQNNYVKIQTAPRTPNLSQVAPIKTPTNKPKNNFGPTSVALKDLDNLTQLAISKSLTEIKHSPVPKTQSPNTSQTNHSFVPEPVEESVTALGGDESCCLNDNTQSYESHQSDAPTGSYNTDLKSISKSPNPITGYELTNIPYPAHPDDSFKILSVPLGELRADADTCPSTLYDKHNIKIMLCKTQNTPLPGTRIITLTVLNNNTFPIEDLKIEVQTVEPCLSKIEPDTVEAMAAFNPLLPPPFTILILYIYKPENAWNLQARFIIRYRLKAEEVESSVIINNIYDCN